MPKSLFFSQVGAQPHWRASGGTAICLVYGRGCTGRRMVDFEIVHWFDALKPSLLPSILLHIEPPRTFSNFIITEIARCGENGWYVTVLCLRDVWTVFHTRPIGPLVFGNNSAMAELIHVTSHGTPSAYSHFK